MNETIGNQQLSNSQELGWLAGIIDGEGCLQLAKQKYKDRYHFRPQLIIGNTNPIIIEEIVRIAKKNGFPVYLLNRHYVAQNSLAEYVVLQIMGLRRVEHWLSVMEPFIVGKKKQAQVILNYISYRLSLPNSRPGVINFGEKDLEFKRQLDNANHQYRTRTAQRLHADQTPQLSEGIVSSHAKV